MNYTIQDNGDAWEKHFHPHLVAQFPLYDEFWRTVIVPSTMRAIDGSIGLRPHVDRDFELLAMSHYSCYFHLGVAREILEMVSERPYLYDDFFFHINSSLEMVLDRFLKYCVKCWKKVQPSARYQTIETALGKDWEQRRQKLDALAIEISHYRNALTHEPRLGQLMKEGNLWIPKHELVTSTRTWEEVGRMVFPSDFVQLDDKTKKLVSDAPTFINAIWPEIISEFQSLASTDQYKQFARITPHEPTKTELLSLSQSSFFYYSSSASGMFIPPKTSSID